MITRLQQTWIYPIKSLDGMPAASARIAPGGSLEHDRRYVLVDAQSRVLRAKQYDVLHRVRASFDLSDNRLTLAMQGDAAAESFDMNTEQPRISAWLGAQLGMAVRLVRLPGDALPDDPNFLGPTVVSSGTLAMVAEWFRLTTTDVVRRFRVNLIVDAEPFWEDRLVAQEGDTVAFTVGSVTMHGVAPCSRCPVPARDPVTGKLDASFTERFIARRDESWPSWTRRDRMKHANYLTTRTCVMAGEWGKTIACGDPVRIVGQCPGAAPGRVFAKFDQHAAHALTGVGEQGAQ